MSLEDLLSMNGLLSGKHTQNYGTSPFLMGKPTISMAIFNIAFGMFIRPGNYPSYPP